MPAVGQNEDAIRSYIRQQEKKDARLDQLNLWCRHHLQVVPKSGPRQRPRTAASSGSSRNAPGFAGGYLLVALGKSFVEPSAGDDVATPTVGKVRLLSGSKSYSFAAMSKSPASPQPG